MGSNTWGINKHINLYKKINLNMNSSRMICREMDLRMAPEAFLVWLKVPVEIVHAEQLL